MNDEEVDRYRNKKLLIIGAVIIAYALYTSIQSAMKEERARRIRVLKERACWLAVAVASMIVALMLLLR